VSRLRRLDRQNQPKELAAARAGMDPKTARKYRRLGKLPSEVRPMEREWRTRDDPFADVWQHVEEQLRLNPRLEAKTLFAELQREHPGKFEDGQLRTLQRRVKQWRALQGPHKEVFFAQVHEPARLCASDFTHCTDLAVTIQGTPFAHLIYHFVLTYSNWETGTICFSESLESLSEGLQNALWELGGVPHLHRTDRLTAAIQPGVGGREAFKQRYQALLLHYGLHGQAIQAGKGNENGDAEQSHRQFKRALDQALMLRGSREFVSRADYDVFLRRVMGQQNAGRQTRFAEEIRLLKALPERRLESCKRLRGRVDKGSTVRVEGNVYSVSSRLIGEWVEMRLYAERLEVWYAQKQVEDLPRLRGRGKHKIEYRHVIDWLVRKPGAFADYRYRADLFPSSRFRMAYDALREQQRQRAAKEYLGILLLAARETESGVEAALGRLLDAGGALSAKEVAEELKRSSGVPSATAVAVGPVDLGSYDDLLTSKEAEDGEGQGCEGTAGGLLEGAAFARIPGELRGAGTAGAAGVVEPRAVSVESDGAGIPGAEEQTHGEVVARVAVAAGEELVGIGREASAGESGAADAGVAGGVVRGPSRERDGVRSAGFGEDAPVVCDCPGAGAERSEGAVLELRAAGTGVADREAGSEIEQSAEASGRLRGADPG
jgi:hypothetical protein